MQVEDEAADVADLQSAADNSCPDTANVKRVNRLHLVD